MAIQNTLNLLNKRIVLTQTNALRQQLADKIKLAGGSSVAAPVITLCAYADHQHAKDNMQYAQNADHVIFVSPMAVQYALLCMPDWQPLPNTTIIAVGKATARRLRRAGITARVPPQSNSEGILAMSCLQQVGQKNIVIVAAPEGRTLLADVLASRGAKITWAYVYQRQSVTWRTQHLQQLNKPLDAIVFSSEMAVSAFVIQATKAGLIHHLQSVPVIVSSTRVQQAAKRHGFHMSFVAQSTYATDLFTAINIFMHKPQVKVLSR